MTKHTGHLALLVAIIALVLTFFSPRHTAEEAQTTPKEETVFEHVMRTHTIRCGYATWNPVLYKDIKTGEVKGIAHDIMEEVGKKLDLRIDWAEETGWGTLVEGLSTHRYDMVCTGLLLMGQRARVIGFDQPVFYVPTYLVVRKNETRFQYNQDLDNSSYHIVVLDGESFSIIGPKFFPKAQFYSLPQNTDWSLILQDVVEGKADATGVSLSDFAAYEIANPGKLKLININQPLQVVPVSFGLPQGDIAMKTMVDAALGDLYNDGTIAHTLRVYAKVPNEFLLPAVPYAPLSP